MESFHESMDEYKKQLEKGAIQAAYKGLMDYILGLKTHLKNKYPDFFVSGSIYYGYMDMTYFSFFPKSIKDKNLKIAVVFIHESCKFEVWLAGINKQVQTKYWNLIRESDFHKYRIVSTPIGNDSIIEHILVEKPDFRNLDALTEKIELETMKFISDVECFLSLH
jgi:hypothetical protein